MFIHECLFQWAIGKKKKEERFITLAVDQNQSYHNQKVKSKILGREKLTEHSEQLPSID